MNHLDGLNPSQKEAVTHTQGPLLILAGAGAGKTRVITHRILNLIHEGIEPHAILAVTFTNKAAKEMRERVEALLNENRQLTGDIPFLGLPFVSTFHSLGVEILKENHRLLGISKYFTIFDRNDSTKAIRDALKQAGYDSGQFEPKKILGSISKQKSEGLSLSEYEAKAMNEYYGTIVAEVWRKYDAILKKENAFDFDDLLLETKKLLEEHEAVRKKYQNLWSYIHIDEYQDTNKVQNDIATLLTNEKNNICVVGDVDQCLDGNTKITMADGSKQLLKKIAAGDMVLSNYGSGAMRPAAVTHVIKTKHNEALIEIKTRKGRKLVSTCEHTHFAGYMLDQTPQLYFVYLMHKEGLGYRIGTSRTYTNARKKVTVGFKQRSNQEHADALWVLSAHDTENQARIAEYTYSLEYQIPTIPFVPRKRNTKSKGGYVHDMKAIKSIFKKFDTETSAQHLLDAYGLDKNEPHHLPQSRNGTRDNLLVSLCGDARGKTPMHRIAMTSNSVSVKKILKNAGYPIRPAKKGSRSWRFETCNKDFGKIQDHVVRIQNLLPNVQVRYTARLGKSDARRKYNALPFIKTKALRRGMVLFDKNGYDVITEIKRLPKKTISVYDLNIADTHNFIANDLLTHNCIYTWRGARVGNMLNFEKNFPNTKRIILEENYRSTKTIIAASNEIIAKNVQRQEKHLFTNNADGEKISVCSLYGEIDEAYFITKKVKELLKNGIDVNQIAVLYRANFQSRMLEEAFLDENIPYQVLGTRFFDRKEIKDVLSYIRLALNPESITDLKRIINVPTRGIGKITLLRVVEEKEEECSPAVQGKLADFRAMMKEMKNAIETKTTSEAIKYIVKKSGLEDSLLNGKEEAQERLENIRELVTLAKRYDRLEGTEGQPVGLAGIQKLITDASLATDQDELEKKQDGVKLMTVHAAKGLEFDVVFVTGLEEGLFPHERVDKTSDTEEERRLFYVALTRARKKVFLTYTQFRTIFGSQQVNLPSEFISDIDDGLLENETEFISERGAEDKTVYLDLDEL